MPEVMPCAAYYGNTEKKAFPLLLVLGREYNNSGRVGSTVGKYDFDESHGSTFWNRTYSLIARACPEVGNFKQRCIGLDLSPVVFSNVSPQPILNKDNTKHVIRAGISPTLISDHLLQVFAQPIIKRVEAVLFSVGTESSFADARDLVRSKCSARTMHFIDLPYLGARFSNRVVDTALSAEGRSVIRRVVTQFFSSTNEG